MSDTYGTLNGRQISEEMLRGYADDFAKDWEESRIVARQTDRGATLSALQALDIPVEEIEAIERKAKHERTSLSMYVRKTLVDQLTA
jgi:rubrerythrin